MNRDSSKLNLSFAGCGFLCIYHAGVCAAIKEYAPQLTQNKISGTSAGAIAAAGLLCNVCMSKATSTILQVVSEARAGSLQALSPNFNLMKLLHNGLENSLPMDAHIICTNRLFISLTRVSDYQNVIVSDYSTREELIQAIMCSCFIPFYCGARPPKYRGVAYIDGGLSNNQLWQDKDTISVSPFSGESDICPLDMDSASFLGFNVKGTNIQFTTQNLFRMVVILFPPSPEICARICRQGFEDTLRFLSRNAITPCAKCLTQCCKTTIMPACENPADMNPETCEMPMAITPQTRPLIKTKANSRTLPNMGNCGNLRRMDECERCFGRMDSWRQYQPKEFSNIPMPPILQRCFDEAAAAESKILKYLQSFRLFRWTMRFLTPIILPMEIALFTIRTIRSWISRASRTDFYLERLQKIVDFTLTELDNRRLLYEPSNSSRNSICRNVSCNFSIQEIEKKGETITNKTSLFYASQPDIINSEIDVSSPTKIINDERRNENYEDDSMNPLIENSEKFDAILQFYYTDEVDNQLNVCEIFDMNNVSRKNSMATATATAPALAIRKRKTSSIQLNNNNRLLGSNSNRNSGDYNFVEKFPLIAEDSGFSELLSKTTTSEPNSLINTFKSNHNSSEKTLRSNNNSGSISSLSVGSTFGSRNSLIVNPPVIGKKMDNKDLLNSSNSSSSSSDDEFEAFHQEIHEINNETEEDSGELFIPISKLQRRSQQQQQQQQRPIQ